MHECKVSLMSLPQIRFPWPTQEKLSVGEFEFQNQILLESDSPATPDQTQIGAVEHSEYNVSHVLWTHHTVAKSPKIAILPIPTARVQRFSRPSGVRA